MRQPKLGYVVADGGRARVFLRHGSGDYETLVELDREADHRPKSDSRTRVFQSVGTGRSAVGELQDERNRRAEGFAAEVDQAIAQAVADGAFEQFVLAAPPRVLNALRAQLSPDLQRRVAFELPKDLTKLPEAELHHRLDRLGPP